MQGEERATLNTPPNHRLFDPTNTMLNPVLRKHAELAKTQQQASVSTAPVINFTFGRDFADLLRGNAPAADAEPPIYMPPAPAQNANTPPIYTAPPPSNAYDLACPTLLQVNRKPGVDMPLDAF